MFDNIHKTCLEIDRFAANMKGHLWSIHPVSPQAIPWHSIESCDWGLLLKGESNKHVCRDVILRHQSLHFESIEKAQFVIVFTHFWWNVIEWNNKKRGKGAKKELSKQTNKQTSKRHIQNTRSNTGYLCNNTQWIMSKCGDHMAWTSRMASCRGQQNNIIYMIYCCIY